MASTQGATEVAATRLAPTRLLGGIGGLLFVATVIVQNVIRGSNAPKNDAAVGKIVEFYSDHRTQTVVLTVLFVLGAIGLALFIAAMLARMTAVPVRGPALAGAVGTVVVFALFSMVVAIDVALSGYVHRGSPNNDVVSALWMVHNSVFSILGVALGVALAGLCAASAGSGLLPTQWKQVGTVAGLLLAFSAATTSASIDGSAVMIVGLVGFVVWLVFVVMASRALLRNR